MILFLVEYGNAHVIVWAMGREQAKRQAQSWLWDNPDNDTTYAPADRYTVTPLTEPGDRVKIAVTLSV